MELPDYAIAEAKAMIKQNVTLPCPISSTGGSLWLTDVSDKSIMVFGGFEVDGVIYKIGAKLLR